jgi:hypothetical protein
MSSLYKTIEEIQKEINISLDNIKNIAKYVDGKNGLETR